jgi:hypothetical protein
MPSGGDDYAMANLVSTYKPRAIRWWTLVRDAEAPGVIPAVLVGAIVRWSGSGQLGGARGPAARHGKVSR